MRLLASLVALAAVLAASRPCAGQSQRPDTARVVIAGAPAGVSPVRVGRPALHQLLARIDSAMGQGAAAACGTSGLWEGETAPSIPGTTASGQPVVLRLDCDTPSDAANHTITGRLMILTPAQEQQYPGARPLVTETAHGTSAWRRLLARLRHS